MSVFVMNGDDGEMQEATPIKLNNTIVGSVDLNENGWLTIQVRETFAANRYVVGIESDGDFVPIKEFVCRQENPMELGVSIAIQKLANYCAVLSKWQSENQSPEKQ
jgi:hypothetical protein